MSPRGDLVAIVLATRGRLHLAVTSADGANHRSLAPGIEVRGTSAWSPDGTAIVIGGSDAGGAGLFRVSVTDGAVTRLTKGRALDPVWSPDGRLIVYVGQQGASGPLLAIRTDGTPVPLPVIEIPSGGGGRVRFLPDGTGVVYLLGSDADRDFWLLDLATRRSRRLTRLSNRATLSTFDITPDGGDIVFDRLRENADIRLIERPN